MNFSISQLSSLAKLISSNPNEAKAILKLASIDVLKYLGDGKYTISLDNKTLTAQSDKPLSEGAKYWTQMSLSKETTPKLSNLLQMPTILNALKNSNIEYSLKDLQSVLKHKEPTLFVKENLLERLVNASSKEEFSSATALLLSLEHQTLTIPLTFNSNFYILQMKKRYNKKTKKSYIDFYAALELLGPISGLVVFDNGNIDIDLNVAFESTKTFLENDLKNLSYNVNISVLKEIEPIYNSNENSLLDVSI